MPVAQLLVLVDGLQGLDGVLVDLLQVLERRFGCQLQRLVWLLSLKQKRKLRQEQCK